MGLRRCLQVASVAFLGALLPLGLSAQSYGLGEQVLTIGAAAFRGEANQPVFGADGYLYNANPDEDAAWTYRAPLRLPNGAVITGVCGYFRNEVVIPPLMQLSIHPIRMYPGGPDGGSLFHLLTASFNSGYNVVCSEQGNEYTILNDYDFDHDGNSDHVSYRVHVRLQSGSTGFGGVRIFWHRSVSPTPAQPTFGDVAPEHPFFQFIEALSSSAITGGCGNGNFCPNGNLTRGQMAVFLAKALGLHWVN